MIFQQDPTPQKIVEIKQETQSMIFSLDDSIENIQFQIKHTTDCNLIQDLHDELQLQRNERAELIKVLNAKVNLSDTTLEGSLITLNLTQDAKDDYSYIFDEKDLKSNMFVYMGEFKHAPHHVMVIGMSSGRIYPMLHSDMFEIYTERGF